MIRKRLAFFCIVLVGFCTPFFAGAMEDESEQVGIIQQKQGNVSKKKKKKKKKSVGSELKNQECLLLKQIKQEKKAKKKLEELQVFANVLFTHAQLFNALNKIKTVIPILDRYQKYRVYKNKFVRGFDLVFNSPVKFDRYGLKTVPELKLPIWFMRVSTSRGTSAGLILGKFIKKFDLNSDNLALIDRLLKDSDEEVRAVAGFVKHYAYTNKFVQILYNQPQFLFAFANDVFHNTQRTLNEVVFQSITPQILQEIPDFVSLCKQVARCMLLYVQEDDGCDDVYTVLINDKFREFKRDQDQFLDTIKNNKERYEQLYQAVYQEIDQTLASLRRSCLKREVPQLARMRKKKIEFILPDTTNKENLCEDFSEYLPDHIEYVCSYKDDPYLKPAPSKKKRKKKTKPKEIEKVEDLDQASVIDVQEDKQEGKKEDEECQAQAVPEEQATFEEKDSPEEKEPLVQKQIQIPKIAVCYDERITNWFDDDYATKFDYESVLYHSFPRVVDNYIFTLGIETPWKNKKNLRQIDTNYSLGGEIQYDTGERKIVVFSCCKDPHGVCYHRGYTVKEKNSLFDEYFEHNYWQVFHRDEFPPLGQEQKKNQFRPQQSQGGSIVEEDDEICVKILDNRLGVRIVLYKPYRGN